MEERRIEEAKAPLAKIVTASYSHGEAPIDVTFQHLITYHDRTPQIQIAVASYSELITGTDMTIKCKTEPAQKIIDDWVRKTDFYRKFESLVTTCLITGNAILEKLNADVSLAIQYFGRTITVPLDVEQENEALDMIEYIAFENQTTDVEIRAESGNSADIDTALALERTYKPAVALYQNYVFSTAGNTVNIGIGLS